MFIVECYGLPGSGKTFLAKYLKDGLLRNGIEVVNRNDTVTEGLLTRDDGQISNLCKRYLPETLWQRVVNKDHCLQEFWDYLGDHLAYGHVVLKTLLTSEISKEHVRSIIGSVFGTCVEYQLLGNITEDPKSKIFIADEWFCHRFHTLFGNISLSVTTNDADTFIDAIPLPDVAIFVATEPQTCITRMRDRGRFPEYLQPLKEHELSRNLNSSYENLRILTQQLQNTTAYVIDYNGESREPVLDEILERLAGS